MSPTLMIAIQIRNRYDPSDVNKSATQAFSGIA
jgi:hypothetical protein